MRLLINTDRRTLVAAALGLTGTASPVFRQGDRQPLEIILCRGAGSTFEAVDYPGEGWSLRVGVGELESRPITGTFILGYDGDETSALPVNATAQQVADALNALDSVDSAGGVSVEVVAGTDGQPGASFLVTFNSAGARLAIVANPVQLYPRSSTVAVEAVTGSGTERSTQLLRFVRTPVAVATDFDELPAVGATLESVVAWDGERAVTRLVLANALAGSFVLTWHKSGGSSSYSAVITARPSTEEIAEAVSAIDNLSGLVTVYRTGLHSFDIEIRHHPSSSSSYVNGLEVDATAALKVPGYAGEIDLATIELEEMLGGEKAKAATLEVVLEKAGAEMTVLQIPCRVEGDLLEQSPASPLVLDSPLGKTEAAALYLSKAGNLEDIGDASTARANLGVNSATTSAEGLVELATKAESISGLSDSIAATPSGIRFAVAQMVNQINSASTASNGGSTTTNIWDTFTLATSASLSNSTARRWSATNSANFLSACIPGHPVYKLDFSKVVAIRWGLGLHSNSSSQFERLLCFVGQDNSVLAMANDEAANIGFGFALYPNGNLKISARDASGVTSSTIASGIPMSRTTTNNNPATEILQVSDGLGSLFTYIDGVLVDTNATAPTGLSNTGTSPFAIWAAAITNGATTPTAACTFVLNFPKMFFGR